MLIMTQILRCLPAVVIYIYISNMHLLIIFQWIKVNVDNDYLYDLLLRLVFMFQFSCLEFGFEGWKVVINYNDQIWCTFEVSFQIVGIILLSSRAFISRDYEVVNYFVYSDFFGWGFTHRKLEVIACGILTCQIKCLNQYAICLYECRFCSFVSGVIMHMFPINKCNFKHFQEGVIEYSQSQFFYVHNQENYRCGMQCIASWS
eukprot:TRINITY_DN4315_c0_g1_i10.p1 TRINITY_DN4315_c0_g1~~TRINITY_DN4315_c0_g1_i10.p1  ORF type:complete len:203 (-),score=-10.60 TRINITY_DN4315_c0_g1_i10:716-1324(-)